MSWDGTANGRPLAGDQDVAGRHHQDVGLELRLRRKRHVHSHLIAVEVGVIGRTDERVNLDRLALDQYGFKGLDTEAVKSGRTIQEHRVLLDHGFESVPHLGGLELDKLLGHLDGGREFAFFQLLIDEGLEKLEGHLFRQTTLMELELRADHNDRTSRVIDSLAEQVLAKPALLALEVV